MAAMRHDLYDRRKYLFSQTRRPSSSRPPFTTDESLLPTRSPRAQAGYSAQMIGVPTLANKLYFKEGVRVRPARHAGSAIFRFPHLITTRLVDADSFLGRSRRRSRLTAAPASPPAFF
jgi:hypothetical protein